MKVRRWWWNRHPGLGWCRLLVLALCVSCSSDSGSSHDSASRDATDAADTAPTDGTASSVEIPVTVDRSEVGGDALVVLSGLDPGRTLGTSGQTQLKVSDIGAHLVLAYEDDRARGLAISVPDPDGRPSQPLTIDATSTALGLLMLVPGLTVTDPQRAAARIDEFRELDEFPLVVTRLRARLSSGTLEEALEDPQVAEALGDASRAWITAHADLTNTAAARVPFNFAVGVVDATKAAETKVLIKNTAPRHINVYRRLIDEHGATVEVQPLAVGTNAFTGPQAFAVGLWKELHDSVDLSPSRRIARMEYWLTGVGWGGPSVEPPLDLSADYAQHYADSVLSSLVHYVVGPLVTFVTGTFGRLEDKTAKLMHAYIKNKVNTLRLVTARTPDELDAAVKEIVKQIFNPLLQAFGLQLLLDIGISFPATLWGAAFKLVDAFTAGAKLMAVSTYWSLLPSVSFWQLNLALPAPTEDATPPATIGDLRVVARTPTSVTLGWTMPGDDGWEERASYYDVGISKTSIDASNWADLPDLVYEPKPPAAKSAARLTISGLVSGTEYFVAIRVADEKLNWSGLSNVVSSEDTTGLVVTWKPSFFADGPLERGLNCKVTTPCTGVCPQSTSLSLLGINKSLNLPAIRVTESGGVISGAVEGLSGRFGSFDLTELVVTVSGRLHDDGKMDVTFGLDGEATYPADPALLPVSASFTGEISMVGATSSQGRLRGNFTWDAGLLSLASGCTELSYTEHNVGTATLCIDDCRCGDGTCSGCIPAPGRCCCDAD